MSLLSFASNIFEEFTHYRLIDHLDKNGLFLIVHMLTDFPVFLYFFDGCK